MRVVKIKIFTENFGTIKKPVYWTLIYLVVFPGIRWTSLYDYYKAPKIETPHLRFGILFMNRRVLKRLRGLKSLKNNPKKWVNKLKGLLCLIEP